jgi:hypothetical protein
MRLKDDIQTEGAVIATAITGGTISGTTAAFTGAITGISASFTGTLVASNSILSGSDIKLKKDIKPLTNLAWTDKLNFVEYKMKAEEIDRRRYGVIAQEVELLAPELVSETEEGVKVVNYIDLLIAKIARLEQRIKILEDGN